MRCTDDNVAEIVLQRRQCAGKIVRMMVVHQRDRPVYKTPPFFPVPARNIVAHQMAQSFGTIGKPGAFAPGVKLFEKRFGHGNAKAGQLIRVLHGTGGA